MTLDPSVPHQTGPAVSALTLLEQATGAGLWRLDLSTGIVQLAPRLIDLLGRSPQGLDFLAPGWREDIQACIRACADAGASFDRPAQILTMDGRLLWVRLMGQAVRGASGRIEAVEGVVQEIAPRAVTVGALATVNADGRFTYLNAQAEELLGRSATSLQGRAVWGLFQKTARLQVEEQVREALAQGRPLEIEALDARQSQWLELRGECFANGLALQVRDVTARRQSQEQLRLLEGSIARLNDLVIITEAGPFKAPGPRIVFVNDAFEARTGYTRQEVLGRSPRLLQGPQTQRDRLDQIRYALAQWQPVRVDLINYRRDGEPFWVDLDISPVWDKSRRLTHWVAVGRDVTERKAAEHKIRYLAFYDALTGLPNRQLLLERLQATLERRAGAQGGALMFIDLDNFKVLNDTLGHQKGDQLLQQVARRLRACVSPEDTVARLGGDEFVVLLEPVSPSAATPDTGDEAAAVADRIRRALGEPYPLPGTLHHSTCSIGVTVFGPQRVAVSELLKQADLAMYQAKRAGRNAVCFFDPQMQAVASANAALAADLRQAWREGQFLLDYQPQVDRQGRMTGVEALLRWAHPARGRVPPSQFIGTAEETSLILDIGRWVLEQACAQLARWAQRPDRRHLSVAVNVSARQFRDPQFVDEVMEAIARSGIVPNRLKLELTESLLADGIEVTVAKMGNLKAMGVELSLDDFGMGYSSLSYLKRLPLNQLKIDREFVKDLLTDANDAAIARTIIGLAQSLRLDVIAEGVETQAQRDFLLQQGCEAFQGHLYSEPLAIDALEVYIDHH
ncbi:MAG: regulator, domain-like protein [Pseudomonadota bacterium]|jgi:diguanylate cyclase (GGDEF)-like protein/PAS domain S-box-containing protein